MLARAQALADAALSDEDIEETKRKIERLRAAGLLDD